ncbi:hypothetical protein [Nocardioides sp.]|uniref:hypothetical protein n=1 Tax=Nocardioides sp. TaxID=35761 RepID=UPI00351587C7
MLFVVLAVLFSLVVSGLVVLYVAYPHRGEQVPYLPWLGEAMEKAVDRAPTLDEHDQRVLHEQRR